MTQRVRKWISLTALMIALLVGTYVIVERNNAAMNPNVSSPSAGFGH